MTLNIDIHDAALILAWSYTYDGSSKEYTKELRKRLEKQIKFQQEKMNVKI